MAAKRRYELLLVIEATSDEAGRRAVNAAWEAADRTKGAKVADEVAQERLADGSIDGVSWADWQEESDTTFSVRRNSE